MNNMVSLDLDFPIWERFFQVAPLVVVGTRDELGNPDLAPKHLAFPCSWDNFFGFVCSPEHQTLKNLERTEEFAVSFPRPDQVLLTSLAAAPRCASEGSKPSLQAIPTVPASTIKADLVADSNVFLECRLQQTVPHLGPNTLVLGRVVAAFVHPEALRSSDKDDQDLIFGQPLLAYLHPGRFASIAETRSYPFPLGFQR